MLQPPKQEIRANLQKYFVNQNLFSDVTFELDDGRAKSHRAILVARCDVMRAMLNGDFREAHSNVVRTVFQRFCYLSKHTCWILIQHEHI